MNFLGYGNRSNTESFGNVSGHEELCLTCKQPCSMFGAQIMMQGNNNPFPHPFDPTPSFGTKIARCSKCIDKFGEADLDNFKPGMPPIKKENKIGRNDPCPCESGRKYKKCCGK